ncbi:MAG: RuvA C-terminal domain-containing protein [Janthinobacterium lividum]
MNKEVFHSDYDNHPEAIDSEKELDDYLSGIAEEIGWIVICFNSLEDSIGGFLREMMLRDPYQDERLDVFLAEMGYMAKARALVHLYGQAVAYGAARLPEGEVVELEKDLNLAATIRNGYAHADWFGLRADAYIKVKTRSSRSGIIHRYKRIDLGTAKADVRYIVSVRDRLDAVHELVLDTLYDRVNGDEVTARALPLIKYPPSADNKPFVGRAYDETRDDILNALLALGYAREEAEAALKNVPFGVTVADGIKRALGAL